MLERRTVEIGCGDIACRSGLVEGERASVLGFGEEGRDRLGSREEVI